MFYDFESMSSKTKVIVNKGKSRESGNRFPVRIHEFMT